MSEGLTRSMPGTEGATVRGPRMCLLTEAGPAREGPSDYGAEANAIPGEMERQNLLGVWPWASY